MSGTAGVCSGPVDEIAFSLVERPLMRTVALTPRLLVCTLFAVVLASQSPLLWAAEPDSLANSMPAGAIGYVEITGLDSVLDRVKQSAYLETATTSPQFQAIEKTPQYQQAQAVRKVAETQLGMDLWTAAGKLLGGQMAVALYTKPGKKQPDVVAVVRVTDAALLTKLRERLDPFLELAGEKVDTSQTIEGSQIIDFDGKAFVTIRDDSVVASNNRDLFTKAVRLLTGKAKGSLAADKAFQLMNRQMGGGHLLRLFVNTGAIAKSQGGRFIPKKLDNPLVSLLLGGIMELATRSPYAGLTLDVSDDRWVLTAGVAGDSRKLDESHHGFFSKPGEAGTPEIPQLPSLIGGFTIHRDFSGWYQNREQLLEEKVLPGFDKFEAGLGNLLPGKDFGEDVLPLIGKNLTFVAAPQDYSHLDGKPGLQLPGFALIIDLAKPEEAADVFQLFFQTLSAILNIQAGQQGRQPWVMKSETYKDVQISFGRYLEKPAGDRLPLVFNFMPASARLDDKFIISSSLDLCRKLIDELKQPKPTRTRGNRNFDFEFHPGPFAEILEANQQFFHARAIQKGRTPEQARVEFETILKIVRYFDTTRLSTSVKPDAFQVKLEGGWK